MSSLRFGNCPNRFHNLLLHVIIKVKLGLQENIDQQVSSTLRVLQIKDVIQEMCHHEGGRFLNLALLHGMVSWEKKRGTNNKIGNPLVKIDVYCCLMRIAKTLNGISSKLVPFYMPLLVTLVELKQKVTLIFL